MKIIFIELLLVLFLAIILTTDFLLGKEGIGISVYFVIDDLIFSAVFSLQVITVQKSNAVHNELIILASQRTNQRLQNSVVLLFITLHQFMYVLRHTAEDQLNNYRKFVIEIIALVCAAMFYRTSSANNILFLMVNVKTRIYLQNFGR